MASRFDKVVWAVRLAKTRSQASELISKGKVKLNGQQVKPSREPKVGDSIEISKNTATYSYKLIDIIDKRVGPKLVENYLIDTTPLEEVEKFRLYNLSQAVYRDNGSGKPTKKDRRELGYFLEGWGDEEED
ncbi:MAG: RNA-binding S4 domain-containing protein [Fluviicola sp.]|jgi:ribosome-associated heat shock protein Hsp15|nr:RNA-binding S4 domain-containing protein [Fluviicola sp.]